ncbi:MAG: tRNA (N(6)-L-threonylcarbamoyladenosine(37)-C(2))-methylthiotransferase MtaB [Candidatus Auribacter fodinae]|jgi:threonylcarbamoyladenosine tRNA methylthiotransferase MtaB|uniref:tRNA (N(6)-L-threonylcarbamoyladenosine(37)-C(2))-methylthiotransferase n=1 Tax=Candidatus Auribacter fodinae TaxID=2093366 RepID=A0A3A4R3G4_9BACT|nr:MAG: tRNA (N(6)-L-threonylcarbamoyladenosine(37)-C(2))-methylthiotransferase MtaB [Candidatus Auribacter fodinae]
MNTNLFRSADKTFYLYTLGCKVNQYESQLLREQLIRHGFTETSAKEASFSIINTCTVTSQSDAKSRQAIRRAILAHPDSHIIITGCGVEKHVEYFSDTPEVVFIGGNKFKDRISALVRELALSGSVPDPLDITPDDGLEGISRFGSHTRAFVKAQDGCNSYCSYCTIPYVRGESRSRQMQSVMNELKRLADNGHTEIVLTGIHLGQFADSDGNTLPDLISAAAGIPGLKRLRLSSIEPQDIDARFIEVFAQNDTIMPHLHLPLQNGTDFILKHMNRRYTVAEYESLAETLRSAKKDILLTTDLIVGFPGETDMLFEQSLDTTLLIGFSKVHVFPFSARPGTKAYSLSSTLAKTVIKNRASIAIERTITRASEIKKGYIGQTMPVLVESAIDSRKGLLTGFTPNYLKVLFTGPESVHSSIVPVRLTGYENDNLIGEVVR